MGLEQSASIVRVTSASASTVAFGTAFVVHRDGRVAYLVTCAHVVEDVGGEALIHAGGMPANVVAAGSVNGLDLAVLCSQGLTDRSPLSLVATGEAGGRIAVTGFRRWGAGYVIRSLRGQLGERVGLESGAMAGRIEAWDIKIDGDYKLEPGYSGSPVANEGDNAVIGVASHRQGSGERGVAISVAALREVWPGMPSDLLRVTRKPDPAPLFDRHRKLTSRELAVLVDSLLAIDSIIDSNARLTVLGNLPAEIAGAIPRSPIDRVHVANILNTCLKFPGGMASLIEAVRIFEGNSMPMQQLEAQVDRLLPGTRT